VLHVTERKETYQLVSATESEDSKMPHTIPDICNFRMSKVRVRFHSASCDMEEKSFGSSVPLAGKGKTSNCFR